VGKLACLRAQSAAAAGCGRLFFSLIQNPLPYTPFFLHITVCLFSYTFPEPLRTVGVQKNHRKGETS
jgi:hypothetical protein